MGQDLHAVSKGGNDWIGGKLGRPVDNQVLPGKPADSPLERANYNPTPRPVEGLEGQRIIKIASGQNDGAAINTDGELFMWGPNNHGQLGLGDTIQRRSATHVHFPPRVRIEDVSIGAAHTLALSSEGRVYSFGLGKTGVLGHGDTLSRTTPTLIRTLAGKKVIQVAAGQNTHSLFLTNDGKIHICGRNTNSLLGLERPDKEVCATPSLIDCPISFKSIAVGVQSSFAIAQNGDLYGWGNGAKGHFPLIDSSGMPERSDLPVPTLLRNAPPHLVQVVAGSRHVAVLDKNGRIFTWGVHTIVSGQLGVGPPRPARPGSLAGEFFSLPQLVKLPAMQKTTFLDSMANNVFVVTESGQVFGWGQTAHGRLGYPIDAAHSTRSPAGEHFYLAHSPVPIPLPGSFHPDGRENKGSE